MTTKRSGSSRSNVLHFPGPGDRTPTPRALRLVKALPPVPDAPENSDTFETIPGSRSSEPSPDATIVDGDDLGTLVFERAKTIPAAPETELMLDRPLPAPSVPALPAEPSASELPPLVPSAESSQASLADMTEIMFDADAAMFPLKRQPSARRASQPDADIAHERPSRGPALVAHVIPPRRDYALVAALLAWTLAVAFGVYVITTHRASPVAPASNAPISAPALPGK
jgi:hypothetical protein